MKGVFFMDLIITCKKNNNIFLDVKNKNINISLLLVLFYT